MKKPTLPEYIRDMLQRLVCRPCEVSDTLLVKECEQLAERLLDEARRFNACPYLLEGECREEYLFRMSTAWMDYRQGDKYGALMKASFAIGNKYVAGNPSLCYAVGTILKGWAESGMEYLEQDLPQANEDIQDFN